MFKIDALMLIRSLSHTLYLLRWKACDAFHTARWEKGWKHKRCLDSWWFGKEESSCFSVKGQRGREAEGAAVWRGSTRETTISLSASLLVKSIICVRHFKTFTPNSQLIVKMRRMFGAGLFLTWRSAGGLFLIWTHLASVSGDYAEA